MITLLLLFCIEILIGSSDNFDTLDQRAKRKGKGGTLLLQKSNINLILHSSLTALGEVWGCATASMASIREVVKTCSFGQMSLVHSCHVQSSPRTGFYCCKIHFWNYSNWKCWKYYLEPTKQINLRLWGKTSPFSLIWKSCTSDKVPGLVVLLPTYYLIGYLASAGSTGITTICCFYCW